LSWQGHAIPYHSPCCERKHNNGSHEICNQRPCQPKHKGRNACHSLRRRDRVMRQLCERDRNDSISCPDAKNAKLPGPASHALRLSFLLGAPGVVAPEHPRIPAAGRTSIIRRFRHPVCSTKIENAAIIPLQRIRTGHSVGGRRGPLESHRTVRHSMRTLHVRWPRDILSVGCLSPCDQKKTRKRGVQPWCGSLFL